MNAKISVIVPSHNPGKNIQRCIHSLQKQKLDSMEIICVDASSKDGTAQFLEECAEKDSRIRLISCESTKFGALVNEGLEAAEGNYVAIIRPGDYADSSMFDELYTAAAAGSLEIVMSSFYLTEDGDKETLFKLPSKFTALKVINPLVDFPTSIDQSDLFSIDCGVGSAIFSRNFLKKYSIWFSESEIGSYQDISFSFKAWASARKVRFLSSAYLHCGKTRGWKAHTELSNEISHDEIYSVCKEYEEIKCYIDEVFSEDTKKTGVLLGIMMRLKYDSYFSNCDRLPAPYYQDFARYAAEEFSKDAEGKYVFSKYFPSFDWNVFSTWVYDPETFIDMLIKKKRPTFGAKLKSLFKK